MVLEDPVPWTISERQHEELLEYAAGISPPSATSVNILAAGPDGVFRSLDTYLPQAPPVPRKEPRESPPAGEHTAIRTDPVDVPGASTGFLSGRATYLSQCHGWLWDDDDQRFELQRPTLYDTVEDYHNPEGMNQYLARYLENAGAAVFTTRERDLSDLMSIADNDGDGYFETGNGFEDGLAGFADRGPWTYGEDPFDAGTTRRFPASGGGLATWIPEVPADGNYAIYVSWDADSQNAEDAHYRIIHPGGTIDRYFDQTVHGSTWQYVETLWLPRGTGGLTIQLQADSTQPDRYLSADAVRIGGGLGDVQRGGEDSGRPRWEECAVLYTQWNGAPTSIYDPYDDGNGSDPSSRSRWAAWEHPEGEDALYVSWHSNAGGGTGTSTYYYEGSWGDPVEGSAELATWLQDELVDSIRTLWDAQWTDRGVRRDAFSEINPSHNSEMPAALVELAFHDSSWDVEFLKEPDFRRDAARAMYRAIVQYFAERDGLEPLFSPEPPEYLALVHGSDGQLLLSWEPGPHGAPYGDQPDSYLVFTSSNGHSWDTGRSVTGTSLLLDSEPCEELFVRVSAVNDGGVSFPSEVMGARRSLDGSARILVVSAFDRLETSTLVWEDIGSTVGDVVHMYLWRMNSFDITVPHGQAIGGAGYSFDSVSDDAFVNLDLSPYDLIVWATGEESTHDETFSARQQELVRTFVENGGSLLASGAEILWDLDYNGTERDRLFAEEILGATMLDDDAVTTAVDGVGVLADLVLDFGEEQGAPYPVEYPDSMLSGRTMLAEYSGGEAAAVMGNRVALFGFPLDCIGDEGSREELVSRLLPILLPEGVEPDECAEPGDTGGTSLHDSASSDSAIPAPSTLVPIDDAGGCGCDTAARYHVAPALSVLLAALSGGLLSWLSSRRNPRPL